MENTKSWLTDLTTLLNISNKLIDFQQQSYKKFPKMGQNIIDLVPKMGHTLTSLFQKWAKTSLIQYQKWGTDFCDIRF